MAYLCFSPLFCFSLTLQLHLSSSIDDKDFSSPTLQEPFMHQRQIHFINNKREIIIYCYHHVKDERP